MGIELSTSCCCGYKVKQFALKNVRRVLCSVRTTGEDAKRLSYKS